MAYRRRHGMGRSSTFDEEPYRPPEPTSSLAAQAIKASAAHRDSSHSPVKKGGPTYDYTSMGSSNETGSFWGVLARKAKAILDDDNVPYEAEYSSNTRQHNMAEQIEMSKKMDNPTLQKGIDAFTSSMNRIGDSIGNALEEGRTMVENKTADFIQETRRIQIMRKGYDGQNFVYGANGITQQSPQRNFTSQEDQLKASRDVAMATAAKAKLLLRELKTVKADLAFAKQRCSQLEEENKILRDAREKGVHPEDDDMIRLQLETLLEEKARLAHENSVYTRENRFLREIVEYHQLTMQDVVYLDEGIEEVTEVYPIPAVSRRLSVSPPFSPPRQSPSLSGSSSVSLSRSSSVSLSRSSSVAKDMIPPKAEAPGLPSSSKDAARAKREESLRH